MKWLISIVLPGVEDVIARPLCLVSIFINDDFPTLERPINAYSCIDVLGQPAELADEIRNRDDLISICNYEVVKINVYECICFITSDNVFLVMAKLTKV